MKLVQMLSMRDDILPTEALQVLSVVQSSVPPMDYAADSQADHARARTPAGELFAWFDEDAFAAASLGQVHTARLKSGEDVVVKVQYPGVEETVKQDLKNIKALLQTFTLIGRDVMRQHDRPVRGLPGTRGAPARGARLRQRGEEHRAVSEVCSATTTRSSSRTCIPTCRRAAS